MAMIGGQGCKMEDDRRCAQEDDDDEEVDQDGEEYDEDGECEAEEEDGDDFDDDDEEYDEVQCVCMHCNVYCTAEVSLQSTFGHLLIAVVTLLLCASIQIMLHRQRATKSSKAAPSRPTENVLTSPQVRICRNSQICSEHVHLVTVPGLALASPAGLCYASECGVVMFCFHRHCTLRHFTCTRGTHRALSIDSASRLSYFLWRFVSRHERTRA